MNICKTFIYPVAQYGVHLLPHTSRNTSAIGHRLEELDYKVIEYAMGCISSEQAPVSAQRPRIKGRLPRMLKLAKLPDWSQKIRLAISSLENRIKERADNFFRDKKIQNDIRKFCNAREVLGSPKNMSRDDLKEFWEKLRQGKTRIIPIPKKGFCPILYVRDRQVRENGIKWYFGSFPGRNDSIKNILGEMKYNEIMDRLRVWMKKEELKKEMLDSICEEISTIYKVMEDSI